MKTWQKRMSAWLVALVMVFSLLPAAHAAADAYTVSVTPDTKAVKVGDTVAFTAEVLQGDTKLDELGDLALWFWADGWNDHAGAPTNVTVSDTTGKALSNSITFNETGTFYIAVELKNGDARLAIAYAAVTAEDNGGGTEDPQPGKLENKPVIPPDPLPTPVEAGISVPYVPGSEGDFIRGADVSSLLSILNSGARFMDWHGNSLGDTPDAQGAAFMELLTDAGVNWIRLRVWNDPFDKDGHGYGGGNNDLEAAVTMGKWATGAGMKVLIDFHYSDFWADPGKQKEPKAWAGHTVEQKAAAIAEFTTDSLNTLLDAGVDVGMVQVGNETTNTICGVKTTSADGCRLFDAGCDAVHAVAAAKGTEILAAVHFTNPERSGNYANYAKVLSDNKVSYDVFASSYYPFWHGTTENLTAVLKQIADTYGKYVMVAETSWATTLADGDGHDNTVRKGTNDNVTTYPFSVQGQATEVASVMRAVTDVGTLGIGAFYWEPAWIPVHDVSKLEGEAKTAQIDENRALWEEYGSGWASSYAREYDPEDAGKWFGGSAVDNQAVFNFEGRPLESLNVFKYVTTGATAPAVIETVYPITLEYEAGDSLALPGKVTVTNSAGVSGELTAVWNEAQAAAVNMEVPGTYTVTGTVSGSVGGAEAKDLPITCTVTVRAKNLLTNPGFEEGAGGYTLTGWAGDGIKNKNDVHSGSWCLHFYKGEAFDGTVSHDPVTLEAGTYRFTLFAQGASAAGYISVKDSQGRELGRAELAFSGWKVWSDPVVEFTLTEETAVTVGASISVQAGGWGTFDDWYLSELPPAHIHELTYVAPVEPTTDTEGNIAYWRCPGCGKLFRDGKAENEITLQDTVLPRKPSGGTPQQPAASAPSVRTTAGNGTSAAKTIASPSAAVKNGTASATVNAGMGKEIVKQAIANKSGNVTVAPRIKGKADRTEVSVPASAVGELGSRTGASLTVSTPLADVTLPNGALSSLSKSGGNLTVAVGRTGNTVEFSVTAGGKTVERIPGGIEVTVPAEESSPGTVAVIVREDGSRQVVRKSVAGNGSITFPLDGPAKIEVVRNEKHFNDVPSSGPVADAAAFVSAHELFSGDDRGNFNPGQPMDRGMLAVVLHNLEHNPEQPLTGAFADVKAQAWYAQAVEWAAAEHIVDGYGNGLFGPGDKLTQEQLAVMLWRYAGRPAAAEKDLSGPSVQGVSVWAQDAMRWAAEKNILTTGEKDPDPSGEVSRALAAQVLKNFLENQCALLLTKTS